MKPRQSLPALLLILVTGLLPVKAATVSGPSFTIVLSSDFAHATPQSGYSRPSGQR